MPSEKPRPLCLLPHGPPPHTRPALPTWCTGALAIGLIAGALSTAGYQYLGPALESRIGLRDTCGVHNLHGLPGILGGLAATVASVVTASKSGHVMHHGSRWVRGAGCVGGWGCGLGVCVGGMWAWLCMMSAWQ